MTFSLNSLNNALNSLAASLRSLYSMPSLTPSMSQSTPSMILNPSPVKIFGKTPSQSGGYFGQNSVYSKQGLGGVATAFVKNFPVISQALNTGVKATPEGQIIEKNPLGDTANASEYPSMTSTGFQYSPSVFRVTDQSTSTVPGAGVPRSMGGAGQGLGPGGGAGIGLSGQNAPMAGTNNPPGKTSIGGSTGIGYGGGVGGAGYSSGAVGISGQTAPVAGTNLPPPPTSINNSKPVGQFEAMIRALQKLNPQSGYVQTPLEGGFGPGYGMGNALKRIREYQTMYNQ